MRTPEPRASNFMGRREGAAVAPDGTWLEPESLCYPGGGMARRAYARCEDGARRVVVCGIPDTFFSIPAYYREGKRVKGFVTSDEAGFKFIAYRGQP